MIFIWDMDSNALNITQMAQWMARYGDLAVKSRVHAAADLARAPELARFRLHCLQPPFAADLKPSQFRRTYPRSIKKSLILGLSPPLCKNTVQNRISNCTPQDSGSNPSRNSPALWVKIVSLRPLYVSTPFASHFLLMHVFASITMFFWWLE
jgi:hypothetical protein